MPTCLRFEMQFVAWAFCLARASAGNSIAAKMAMMAITTSNSIRVNARACPPLFLLRAAELRIRSFTYHEFGDRHIRVFTVFEPPHREIVSPYNGVVHTR